MGHDPPPSRLFPHLPSPKAGVFFAGVFRVRSHPDSRPSLEELGQAQQHLRSVGGEGQGEVQPSVIKAPKDGAREGWLNSLCSDTSKPTSLDAL